MLDTLLRDVRLALRTLAKTPAFTAAVIATIALGIGATTAIFTVVDAILLRPLPFPGSERAVVLCETNPSIGNWCGASPANVADWTRTSRTLESAGVARTEGFIAQAGNENYSVMGGIASPGFFRVLGARPLYGRLFADRDMDRASNQVVMVSHTFWRQRLGGDPRVVGQGIVLDKKPFTIIGVLPPDVYVPPPVAEVDVWKPLTASIDDVEDRSWRGFRAIGLMAPGTSPASLQAELETIRGQLAKAYPEANRNWGLRIAGLRAETVGEVSATLWVFFAAVGFVLLIACANVASLLLVRASGRAVEFALRTSLGAPRRRLVQQLVTESFVMSLAGGGLGLLLAAWATSAFVALAPASIPRLSEVAIDARIAVFAFVLSAVTALIFGSAPARQASKADLNVVLKGHRGAVAADTRLRSTLVVVELALAMMLLVGAGLLVRSFGRLSAWDPGFDREGLVTPWMVTSYRTVGEAVPAMERVRDAVAAVPGVRAAALGSAGPLFGGIETSGLKIEGRPAFDPHDMPTIRWFDIDPHYFRALGIRLLRGRDFTAADTERAAPVALVNDTFARRFLAGSDPIGQRVTVQNQLAEIVGVVADVKPLRPDGAVEPEIYWPIRQYRRLGAYLVLRTTPGVSGIEKSVRARAASVDATIQLSPFVSLDERLRRNLVTPRFNMLLVAAFAVVAVLLAAVGVYGVIAYGVASRTREIGVRMALGATPRGLVASLVRQGMIVTGLGIAIGCAGALAIGRLMAALLYGLSAGDPLTLAGSIVLFALVAFAACWLPARRASRVDPISALRME
jgi:putative ABC transport system permease protein